MPRGLGAQEGILFDSQLSASREVEIEENHMIEHALGPWADLFISSPRIMRLLRGIGISRSPIKMASQVWHCRALDRYMPRGLGAQGGILFDSQLLVGREVVIKRNPAVT